MRTVVALQGLWIVDRIIGGVEDGQDGIVRGIARGIARGIVGGSFWDPSNPFRAVLRALPLSCYLVYLTCVEASWIQKYIRSDLIDFQCFLLESLGPHCSRLVK